MPHDLTINALVPWYGSKRRMAAMIVRQLGPHHTYWEPFCGSMSVLLAKPACRQETVNDLHGDLINLARVIADPVAGAALYRSLRRTWVTEDTLQDAAKLLAAGDLPESPDMGRAYHFFIASWFGRNGLAGTTQKTASLCVRYTSNGGAPGKRFTGAVESIPGWRRRMREVLITSRCGINIMERLEDKEGTVAYVDPPYLSKTARYRHDFEGATHGQLAEALRRFQRTRIVLSYYDDPLLGKLYPGWTKIDCSMSKSMSVQNEQGAEAGVAPEVLLVNGPQFGL